MQNSKGIRFLFVGVLTLFMFIPVFFVAEVVNDRANYSRNTISALSTEWGGAQSLNGPRLVIPVTKTVEVEKTRSFDDPTVTGGVRHQRYTAQTQAASEPLYIYPNQFEANIDTRSEERYRGIFKVPVYRATATLNFDFDFSSISDALDENETVIWEDAILQIGTTSNHGLRGRADLVSAQGEYALEPLALARESGLQSSLGDPRDHGEYILTLGLNGAETFSITPVGRNSEISIASDWPHPSFTGRFLPDEKEISDTGFQAAWTVSHLARNIAQISREPYGLGATQNQLGVRYYQPNDFYQKAYRISNYAILFIALTFLTVLLLENKNGKPVHMVQYLMVGLVQALFVVLMLSYAEQIGFTSAYILSAAATTVLIAFYGFVALKMGARSWLLGGVLAMLYAVLYLILQTADYALITGSTMAFMALAGVMFATRNEDWFGGETGARTSWFARKPAVSVNTPKDETS